MVATELIGSLVFFVMFSVTAIILQWYVSNQTQEEEYKIPHKW
jgi:hypothetical protein